MTGFFGYPIRMYQALRIPFVCVHYLSTTHGPISRDKIGHSNQNSAGARNKSVFWES
jgi:hypothetical protein